MNEMIGYIFGSMRASEVNIHKIKETLKRQQKFNRSVVLFSATVTLGLYLYNHNLKIQRKKIQELEKEIAGLKEKLEVPVEGE